MMTAGPSPSSENPGSKPARVVAWLCLAEVLSMTGFAAYPAFLAPLRDLWGLSSSEAGLIGGAFFAGYMTAVFFLSAATDRVDARRVHLGCCLLSAASLAGFAALASGLASAVFFQVLSGAGLAGTYMPGLKALTDRVGGPRRSRYVSYYTSAFGVGTSLSFLLAGWLGRVLSWPGVFALLAVGPLAAAALVRNTIAPSSLPKAAGRTPSLFPRPAVLRLPGVPAFIVRYAAHCWELFGLRSWMVAFLLFGYGLAAADPPGLAATEAAAWINLLGIPASILGNETAMRVGRSRFIPVAMAASGLLSWCAGFSALLSAGAMLAVLAFYYIAVMSESAALTAGLVEVTPAHVRGAVMAFYSFAGFGAGFLAPVAFGAVLDAAGGKEAPLAWGLAFGSLGAGCLLSALAAPGRGGPRNKPPS
ncbi:MAG: MFS transporter [Desulfobacterales bacterium]